MELEQRINHAAQRSKGFEPQVSALELWLNDDQAISEAQAIDLALAVKAVTDALEQHDTIYAYQHVYEELYQLKGVTSYRNLPRSRYDSLIEWLRNWYKELESTT